MRGGGWGAGRLTRREAMKERRRKARAAVREAPADEETRRAAAAVLRGAAMEVEPHEEDDWRAAHLDEFDRGMYAAEKEKLALARTFQALVERDGVARGWRDFGGHQLDNRREIGAVELRQQAASLRRDAAAEGVPRDTRLWGIGAMSRDEYHRLFAAFARACEETRDEDEERSFRTLESRWSSVIDETAPGTPEPPSADDADRPPPAEAE